MNRRKIQTRIYLIDRDTQQALEEKIAGKTWLLLLYPPFSWLYPFSQWLLHPWVRMSFISSLYGYLQKLSISKRKIPSFIRDHKIKSSEFQRDICEFSSFNDFFIRKLKTSARPLSPSPAIIFADGRYLFYPKLSVSQNLIIKNQTFDLGRFVGNRELAKEYQDGCLIIARLCPSDYHRFHFPFNCTSEKPQLLNGSLLSVNPLALQQKISIFWENKRYLTVLHSPLFGKVLFIEIGATNVGSVFHQPHVKEHQKGEEKGYFSFGGSCLAVLFPPKTLQLDEDLYQASQQEKEWFCKLGQSLGNPSSKSLLKK